MGAQSLEFPGELEELGSEHNCPSPLPRPSEVTQQLGHWTTVDPQARANQERLGLGQRVTALVLTPSRELRLQVLIIPAPGNSSQ